MSAAGLATFNAGASFSGNVGIGITTPDAEPRLHVRKGDAGGVDSATNSVLTIENNTTAILQFLTPNTANQQIRFGDPQDTGAGFIQYNHSANAIQFGTNGPEKMRLDVNGNLLVATTSPILGSTGVSGVQVGASFVSIGKTQTTTGTMMTFNNGNGQVGAITTAGSSTSYSTSSDYRLKENVTADWDATTRLKQLNPVRFNFIAEPDVTVDGFLAHEAQVVVPDSVTGTRDAVDEDGNPVYQGIDQSKLVPLLVKTIQELEARISALEAG